MSGAASIVMYRVGGRSYPLKSVAQCKVCASPHRLEVEQQIINARTYAAICRSLPEDADLSPRNLADHYKNGHMPLEQETLREIVDERARIRGLSIENGTKPLVDHVVLAQTVVQKTYESLAAGTITPTIREGIRAAALLHNVGMAEGDNFDQEDLVLAFTQFMEHARALMPPEMWDEFGRRLTGDPVLKALSAKHSEGEVRDGEIVDVEVVDE